LWCKPFDKMSPINLSVRVPAYPVLFFSLFLLSCSPKKSNINHCQGGADIYSLERDAQSAVSFDLDSLTSPNINYLKITNIDDSTFLTFLNPYNNTVYGYEYGSRTLHKAIKLEVPGKLSGYEVVSWEKILGYRYADHELTWHNGKGEMLSSIKVPFTYEGYHFLPTTHAPIIFDGESIYLSGGMMSREKATKTATVVARIDTALSKVDYLYHFPEVYTEMFFGGEHYRMDIAYAYNAADGVFVFSFPASHELFSTKDFLTEEKHCAGSRFVAAIPEYPYRGRGDSFRYVEENGFYYSVLHDRYNERYYRLCLLPAERAEKKAYTRDLSVLIFDKNLDKIGETVLKDGIDYRLGDIAAICVSPEGLLIPKVNEDDDESTLDFYVYNVVKKQDEG